MAEEEYSDFMAMDLERYAGERARNLRLSVEHELAAAKKQIANLLPEGQRTKGHCFRKILDSKTGQAVGDLWFHLDESERTAFVYDIVIQKDYRGKGYGRRTLQLLEEKLRPMGIRKIALHVFNDNAPAKSLYSKLGYYVVSLNMQKDL